MAIDCLPLSPEEWQRISEGFNDTADQLQDRETAIREREQRLEVLNRVLRHNLSNDLTVVTGYIDMAIDEIDDEGITDMLEIAADETDGLITLGEKARQIDKAIESAEAGTVPVEITSELRSALADLESEYPAVSIETALPEECWVDALGRIGSALENLCENAVEHNTAEAPSVSVSMER
ncbi:MAG: hypothetical protein U5K37_11355 [Natrialbaceae archaeon]|nr:hypothetical protein [Natrialbaceae archaeon]